MGFDISWLAVKDKNRQIVLDQLGLAGTNTLGEFFDNPVSGFALPGGWYLVVTEDHASKLVTDSVLSLISAGCSVIACRAEEHVMFSSAALWENGRKQWSVTHEGDNEPENLNVTGQPPEAFEQIRNDLMARQKEDEDDEEEVDWYFEIPLELAKQLTGFKHDEIIPEIPEAGFEILALKEGGAEAKHWWKFGT